MGIGWREVLGLLIGLAICYAVLNYALTNAPQYRETASEQTQESTRSETTEQQATSEDEDRKRVTIRITGSSGLSFGANYGNLDSSRSVEGVTPADYEATVRTARSSGDYVSVTAWKTTGDSRELKVQILDKGQVIRETSTTKDYGATGVRYNPNDPDPPPETTTPAKEKKAGEPSVPQSPPKDAPPQQPGIPKPY